MQCFRHPERAAVGICKHCQRGLCPDCVALVDDILACRDVHEEDVAALTRKLTTEMLQADRVRSVYIRNCIFYGLVGTVFAALGTIQLRFHGLQAVFLIAVGALQLYAATANLLEARGFP